MTNLPTHFRLPQLGTAAPEAMIVHGRARFTILTERVIRLEYSPREQFEDRESQAFWYRQQAVPEFDVRQTAASLTILTNYLELTYTPQADDTGFTPTNLRIRALHDPAFVWQYGDDGSKGNLLGTYRTLDGVSGSTPLEQGLLSREGWSLVDDSQTLVFNEVGWLEPRPLRGENLDLYFFGHGRDYPSTLYDFRLLTGKVPLLPRWALGNWWSRYWAYTADELADLMRDFQAHDVPLSVCIIDMDWHITDTPHHSGWTGYTWNRELFPDPPAFLAWLHEQGLKTALNLHPALGIAPHEEAYPKLAERLGLDPAKEKTIPFDIATPDFALPYLEELHHPLEEMGVDFWWMDWQQGELSGLPGLDPLWWLNHLHALDRMRENGGEAKRPFIFSRWGGLGNHRYPIGFSGDTFADWPSLHFQPYFTATAANVSYGWWSHDIGGHMAGIPDGELYTRWVQFGVFSPIMRLHSTNNAFLDRRPWGYEAEAYQASKAAMQLRHALIPYLYSMNWRTHKYGESLTRPLYHLEAEREEAYACPQAYTFGTELIAAPFTQPADPDVRLSRQVVWLPPGDWFHFFTGRHYAGGQWQVLYGDLREIPVFAKAGGIVPLATELAGNSVANPAGLTLHCFPGGDGEFRLYEDEGEGLRYMEGAASETLLVQKWDDAVWEVTVHTAVGTTDHLPPVRHISLELYALHQPQEVRITIDDEPVQSATPQYDAAQKRLSIPAVPVTPSQKLVVRVMGAGAIAPLGDKVADVHHLLRHFRLDTNITQTIAAELPHLVAEPARLFPFMPSLSESQRRALLEVITETGLHFNSYRPLHGQLLVWNNHGREDVQFSYHYRNGAGWGRHQFTAVLPEQAPTFRLFTHQPPPKVRSGANVSWQATLNYAQTGTITLAGQEEM